MKNVHDMTLEELSVYVDALQSRHALAVEMLNSTREVLEGMADVAEELHSETQRLLIDRLKADE